MQVVFSVIVPAEGPTLVNGEPVADDEAFLKQAREALGGDRELRAVINADGAVLHRRIIHALDLLKAAGVVHVAFGALPPEGAPP